MDMVEERDANHILIFNVYILYYWVWLLVLPSVATKVVFLIINPMSLLVVLMCREVEHNLYKFLKGENK